MHMCVCVSIQGLENKADVPYPQAHGVCWGWCYVGPGAGFYDPSECLLTQLLQGFCDSLSKKSKFTYEIL